MFPVANHPSNGADWQLQGTVGLETELRQVFSQAFLCQATTTHIRSETAVLMLPEYNFIFFKARCYNDHLISITKCSFCVCVSEYSFYCVRDKCGLSKLMLNHFIKMDILHIDKNFPTIINVLAYIYLGSEP